MNEPQPTNLQPKTWGLSIDRWISLVQTLGIPTLFMAFVCFLAWRYIPPVVDAHVELLQRTGDTLESMEITLKQSAHLLDQLAEADYPQADWRVQIFKEHTLAQQTIDKHSDQLEAVKSVVDGHTEVLDRIEKAVK